MIFRDSRYEGVSHTGVLDTDGNIRKTLHNRRVYEQADVGSGASLTTPDTREVDALAFEYSGREEAFWLICDVNGVMFPLGIPQDRELIIPDDDLFRRAA